MILKLLKNSFIHRSLLAKMSTLTLALTLTLASFSQQPDFSIMGYAALNGGTTGGAGGDTVRPATFAELVSYVEAPATPYIIMIYGEFNTGIKTWVDETGTIVESTASGAVETTFGDILRIGSNKTLLGVGDSAFFNRIGIVVQCQSNIIIRNIRFTMAFVPATVADEYKILDTDGVTTIGDPDCIGMQADDDDLPEAQRYSRNIWIDHCEFYNEDPNEMTIKDRYDGLVDMKNEVQYATISWCYFHDHHKGCLNGKGDSDDFDRLTTMHHNKFENIGARMPLMRFGHMHYFNNYVYDCPAGDGFNTRINSVACIERNYFDNVKKPVFGKPSEGGAANMIDNRFIDCSRLPAAFMPSDSPDADTLSESEELIYTDWLPPYVYSNFIDSVDSVPAIVDLWVGVGKLGISDTTSQGGSQNSNSIVLTENDLPDFTVINSGNKILIQAGAGSDYCVYAVSGRCIVQGKMENYEEYITLSQKGVYIVRVGIKAKKVIVEF